ncbi:uncharacterized protein UTRI_01722_B [Ustilago trichophora]|uniref:Uncharacterized protein n=1 Tax=Ustilago trichophora TaxID=86804 RepID=A0A5C3E3Q0_9BASI|nr:uncharacterized protein UTRI_01722_B [Ustilago trichophora]
MPFSGAGGQSFQPMSAPLSNNVSSTSESSSFTTPGGAATWPPSAASSSVTSLMDSSLIAPITEINLVSSPPTSHAASPSRRSSPLRPSTAGNILESPSVTRELAKSVVVAAPPAHLASAAHREEACVVNSDPEDGTHAGETDGADTPHILGSPSPSHSNTKTNPAAQANLPDEGSSVYVQIPPSSPSTMMPRESSSAKKKPKKQKEQQQQQTEKTRRRGSDASDYDRPSPSSIMDDAAYAAALAAQEETLARRRPTRNARKEVSYQPNCDPEGRPLPPKKGTTASGSLSKSKASASTKDSLSKETNNKRRSRVFSDDEDDEEHDNNRSATGSLTKANTSRMHNEEDDADLTDDDVGFQARDRKKPRVSNPISIDSGDEKDSPPKKAKAKAKATSDRSSRKRTATEDEEDDNEGAAALSDVGDDGILTPPAPTSPRRSSRKSVPSPKKQQLQEKAKKPSKGKTQKTFDLEMEAVAPEKNNEEDEEEEEEEQVRKSPTPKTAQQPSEPSSPPPLLAAASSASKSAESTPVSTTNTPSAPASVAIKRITTATAPSTPSASAGARSFFGKPLTTLLTPNAARRPGLTRKTNIPSLLHHRGVPKAPVAKLAVSKRRMQDDDYEYDAEYEALIAKDKGSDEEDDDETHRGGGMDGEVEGEDDVEVEYD